MLFFGQQVYRVIAHDRRGHGRSSQTWDGNEMDTYSDDLAALFEALDLKNAIILGHSTGSGEVARYLDCHGNPARGESGADARRAAAHAKDRKELRWSAGRSL